ncbi:MAG: LON peptidase substrate-binding domain-containing protein [Acidimicrobiales bacterium]
MPDTQPPETAGSVETLPVLATTTGVIGPSMVVTVAVETTEARTAIAEAVRHDGRLLVVPRRADGRYGRVGTVAKIEQDGNLPNGERAVVLRGLQRAVLGAGVSGHGDGLWVEAEPTRTIDVSSPELDRLVTEYRAVVEAILEHRGARPLAESIAGLHDPNAVADLALYSPDLDFDQKVEVLETVDVTDRLRLVLGWAKDTLAELTVRDELRRNLEDQLGKEQREAVLRRQLAAIQAELDDGDADADGSVAAYRAKLAALVEAGVAPAVTDAIAKELDKLARTPAQNPEHGWIVGWLDTVFALPWAVRADRPIDLDEARRVLDADHAGLEKVKTRLIEYLAVRKLRADRARAVEPADHTDEDGDRATAQPGRSGRARSAAEGSILLLVGPPGVGKTSLGESVARALGRPFAACRWAASVMRPRSVVTGAPTSAPGRPLRCGPSPRPAP